MPSLEARIQRRVAGHHDFRLDGMGDLLHRAMGASVFDVGCNRGLVGLDFAHNGAKLVYGCDNYVKGIETAREVFEDVPNVKSRFEIVDLTKGPLELKRAFGNDYTSYDFVLMIAIYHKLKRVMAKQDLAALVVDLADRAKKYIAWRGYIEEVEELDKLFTGRGFELIHKSTMSESMPPAAIWRRK